MVSLAGQSPLVGISSHGSSPAPARCCALDLELEIFSPVTSPDRMMIRSVACYKIERKVGEGTYGAVYLAHDKKTGARVALKKIKLNDTASEKEGITITTLREINHIFKLTHANVVHLVEVVYGGHSNLAECQDLFMVLEYLEHDLLGIQQRLKERALACGRPPVLSIPDVKCYMAQLMAGLHACHEADILHRDLKSANLLVDRNGVLKIADFGLSRKAACSQSEALTPKVCTLWYRPPELLMTGGGNNRWHYGAEVDIWSAGCIFAELLAGQPLFDKNTETEALYAICSTCGSPDPKEWPQVTKLPCWEMCRKEFKVNKLGKVLTDMVNKRRKNQTAAEVTAVAEGIEIVVQMLSVTPSKRPKALDLRCKDWFNSESVPPPSRPEHLEGVKLADSHVLDFEKKRPREEEVHLSDRGYKNPRHDPSNRNTNRNAPDNHQSAHGSRPSDNYGNNNRAGHYGARDARGYSQTAVGHVGTRPSANSHFRPAETLSCYQRQGNPPPHHHPPQQHRPYGNGGSHVPSSHFTQARTNTNSHGSYAAQNTTPGSSRFGGQGRGSTSEFQPTVRGGGQHDRGVYGRQESSDSQPAWMTRKQKK